MKLFSTFFNKFVWFIVTLLLLGTGSVLALKFLSPPPVKTLPSSSNGNNGNTPTQQQQQQTQATTTEEPVQEQTTTPTPGDTADSQSTPTPTPTETPTETSTPEPSTTTPSPAVTASLPAVPTPFPTSTSATLKPDTAPLQSTSTTSVSTSSSALPALELSNKVALTVPLKMERGAKRFTFKNVDDNSRPDPDNYSPIDTKPVAGLSLTSLKQSEFQQVEGYILVEKTGNYAFVVSFPDNLYLDFTNLRLRIDGQPLSNVKGGNVTLEKGWHKVDLFYWEANNSTGGGANQIEIKWGLEGSNLKRMQTWREVS